MYVLLTKTKTSTKCINQNFLQKFVLKFAFLYESKCFIFNLVTALQHVKVEYTEQRFKIYNNMYMCIAIMHSKQVFNENINIDDSDL